MNSDKINTFNTPQRYTAIGLATTYNQKTLSSSIISKKR